MPESDAAESSDEEADEASSASGSEREEDEDVQRSALRPVPLMLLAVCNTLRGLQLLHDMPAAGPHVSDSLVIMQHSQMVQLSMDIFDAQHACTAHTASTMTRHRR